LVLKKYFCAISFINKIIDFIFNPESQNKLLPMSLNELNAISPIDGRYRNQVVAFAPFFSEFALIRYRVFVEIEYFIALVQLPLPQLKDIPDDYSERLREIVKNFSEKDAAGIKEIEKETNHDVKAVEYFLRKRFEAIGLKKNKEFIHFGLTSQDLNNTALPMMIRDSLYEVLLPAINEVKKTIGERAAEWKDITMLARTHGQPASPTKTGKEFRVFSERIDEQLSLLKTIPFTCKFGGATGNFNAHYAAYPDTDWQRFADSFCEKQLKLKRQQTTTQIEHYDHLAALFDNLKRINTILIDFNRDIWAYISMDYFKQKIKAGEVGSSAMPHKVNPIDFENSEGNLGLANAILEHLSAKLPVSRLQRDLTDSTVTRDIGVPFSHMLVALNSLKKGISKLLINEEAINRDLENNWVVVAEAIQTVLRREGHDDPYGALKELTRTNKHIDQKQLHNFIDSLDIAPEVKNELKSITPWNYTGGA
jgi:adenylosuccinate lyase